MSKVTFLGTNGWYDSKTGNTISILIDSPDYYIVLDAGNGIAKLDRYIRDDRPVYLFISHFHLDHIIGLHTIPLSRFSQGLFLLLQEGGTKIINQFVDFPYTKPFKDMPFKTTLIEVPRDNKLLPFKATFLPMVHASFTLGIRLELQGKIITYCPDTGYCENAVVLSQNADLVITECAYKSQQVSENWPHLNPEFGARIALEAEAKKLILTHFDAKNYPDFQSRAEAVEKARAIFKNTIASEDEMEVEISK